MTIKEICGKITDFSLVKKRQSIGQAKIGSKRFLNIINVETWLLFLGLTLCLWSASGGSKVLCLTRGCELFRDISFAGLSLHVWGAVAFLAALVVKLSGSPMYRRIIMACLWIEVLLLAWQVLSAPCTECLLMGLLWGLLAWLAVREPVSQTVWAAMWTAALVVVMLEMATPWPLYGKPDAAMKIFFSPGCEACQAEINKLADLNQEAMSKVALVPIARNEAEVQSVGRMLTALQRTGNIWMAFMQMDMTGGESQMPWLSRLGLRLRLWGNKLLLGRMGATKVPVAFSYGFDEKDCGISGKKDCH